MENNSEWMNDLGFLMNSFVIFAFILRIIFPFLPCTWMWMDGWTDGAIFDFLVFALPAFRQPIIAFCFIISFAMRACERVCMALSAAVFSSSFVASPALIQEFSDILSAHLIDSVFGISHQIKIHLAAHSISHFPSNEIPSDFFSSQRFGFKSFFPVLKFFQEYAKN